LNRLLNVESFDEIKKRLTEGPALGLPNLEKPFQLYAREATSGFRGLNSNVRKLEEICGVFLLTGGLSQ